MLLFQRRQIFNSVISCQQLQSIESFIQQLLTKVNVNVNGKGICNSNSEKKSDNLSVNMDRVLPFYACGEIVRGFGRGSKDLGMPTANFPAEVVKTLPENLDTGVYYGWANINNGDVHKMVMSIGWNPFYQNKEKSMETHILYNYNKDLYGCLLKVCIVGHLRPETNFNSLDDLIAAIKQDIDQATSLLDQKEALTLKDSSFFKKNVEPSSNPTTTASLTMNGDKL